MEQISRNEIKKFVENIKNHEFQWNKEQRLLHLVEEVGELSEMYLQYSKNKRPFKDLIDIENGLSDIFDDIVALSILFEIDINKIIGNVLKND